MNARIRALLQARESSDRDASYRALVELFAAADEPVDWAYEVWDRMVVDLSHADGHRRAFAAQMLARLARSDPKKRMLEDFPALAAVLRDDKTVTARHTLQSIWRVGRAGSEQKELVLDELARRFAECAGEKNGRLVRTDAITSLGRLFRETGDAAVAARAEALMASEADVKAQKKQRACWKKASTAGPAGGCA
jgi:hypothetical protein